MAEDIENPETKRFEEIVVAFVAIEDGDDSSVAQNAISQLISFLFIPRITNLVFCIVFIKAALTENLSL